MAEIDIFSPVKKYDVIYADPPWRYQDKKCNGACAFHYDTMKIQDHMGDDLNYIELFARQNISGWDCWGNEVGKLDGEKNERSVS